MAPWRQIPSGSPTRARETLGQRVPLRAAPTQPGISGRPEVSPKLCWNLAHALLSPWAASSPPALCAVCGFWLPVADAYFPGMAGHSALGPGHSVISGYGGQLTGSLLGEGGQGLWGVSRSAYLLEMKLIESLTPSGKGVSRLWVPCVGFPLDPGLTF